MTRLSNRATLSSFAIGVLLALATIGLAKLSVYGHAKGLWSRIASLSFYFFPTQIFLLPLGDKETFPHDLIFYLAAVMGNGLIYAFITRAVVVFYFVARKVWGYFV